MNKEILLVWQGTNEQSSGTVTETDDMIVVYLDNKSKWEQPDHFFGQSITHWMPILPL